MSLDLFDPTPALQNAQSHLASDLPADFSEAFDVSTRAMTEWNSSVNYGNARDRALATFYDDVKARTGVQLPLYGMGGNVSLDELNDAITKLPQDPNQPEQSYRPLSENDIDTMALTRMRAAHDDARGFARRETTWGGTLGTITGTLAAGVSDPVALATLPLGGAGQAGIAFRALEFALIGAGTEAAIAGAGASSREAAVPGSLREIPGEIASAAFFGGVFGAGIGGLQKLAGTGARTLPVTVRDEVHAATSEAQLNLSNPFPGVEAEAAHRDGLIDAVMSAIKGLPVTSGDRFPYRLPGTVERLSELQLADIAKDVPMIEERAARARTALDARDTTAVRGEVADLDRASMLGDLRRGVDEVQGERSALQLRIDDALDAPTRERLAAIDAELQAPAVGAKRSAELQQERDMITETLSASSDRDAYQIASMQQEAQALDKLLKRRTTQMERLQAVHDRATAATREARRSIDVERDTVEATLSSQSEIVSNELRRSISRLASEGYGVRLERSEAQELADLVIGNRADQSSLSYVTDTLVSKARQATDAAAAEAGERHLRPITFGERPDVERFSPVPVEVPELSPVSARSLTPQQMTALEADPKTLDAAAHDLDHILAANPDAEFSTQVRMPDGSYQFTTQKLSDVLKELDEFERAGKELEACVIGLEAAE